MAKGSGIPKWAHKRDGNEKAIINALETVGFQAVQLSAKGLPDLIVNGDDERGFPNSWFMEIKSEKGKLTDAQEETIRNWTGKPINVVRTIEEALQVVGF